ncbi:MAG: PEP-CTERM sorting domain-containing protein [Nitrosomonas sp.]|nr:MAG: PEP-CTERM sorting domain-containing protein [Nitrosomonas sp.]
MQKILSILILCLTSTAAFAEVGQPLPEPGTLAIIAAGVAGMWFARRK